jgi:hypothetical protein
MNNILNIVVIKNDGNNNSIIIAVTTIFTDYNVSNVACVNAVLVSLLGPDPMHLPQVFGLTNQTTQQQVGNDALMLLLWPRGQGSIKCMSFTLVRNSH